MGEGRGSGEALRRPLPPRVSFLARILPWRGRTIGALYRGRDNNFNLIRFLAATAVIFSHSYAVTARQEPLESLLGVDAGSLAVNAFFVISGFLVTASYMHRGALVPYLQARALRIFPALWVMLLLVTFLFGPAISTLPPGDYFSDPLTWEYLLANGSLAYTALFLPGVFETNPIALFVNGSLWTLPAEFRMYLLVPVAAALGLLARGRHLLLAALALWAVHRFAPDALFFLWGHPQFPRLAGFFLLGALYYRFRDRIPLHGGVLLLLGLLSWWLSGSQLHPWMLGLTLSYALFWFAFVPGGAIRRFNAAGDYSYGLYIYAFPIQQWLTSWYVEGSTLRFFAVSLLLTLVPAVISWHLVEAPALRLKGRSLSMPRLPTRLPGPLRRLSGALASAGVPAALLLALAWWWAVYPLGLPRDLDLYARLEGVLPGDPRLWLGGAAAALFWLLGRTVRPAPGWAALLATALAAAWFWRDPQREGIALMAALAVTGLARFPLRDLSGGRFAAGAVLLSATLLADLRIGGILAGWLLLESLPRPAWRRPRAVLVAGVGVAWLLVALLQGGEGAVSLDRLLGAAWPVEAGFRAGALDRLPGEASLLHAPLQWAVESGVLEDSEVRSAVRLGWLLPSLLLFWVVARGGVRGEGLTARRMRGILLLTGGLAAMALAEEAGRLWGLAAPLWLLLTAWLWASRGRPGQAGTAGYRHRGWPVAVPVLAGLALIPAIRFLLPDPGLRPVHPVTVGAGRALVERREGVAVGTVVRQLRETGASVLPSLELFSRLAGVPVWGPVLRYGGRLPHRLLLHEPLHGGAGVPDWVYAEYRLSPVPVERWPAGLLLLERRSAVGAYRPAPWEVPLEFDPARQPLLELAVEQWERGEGHELHAVRRAHWLGREVLEVEAPGGPRKRLFSLPLCVPPRGVLHFAIALHPATWSPRLGDGVLFEVFLFDGREIHPLFSRYLDPKNHMEDRGWQEVRLPLPAGEGAAVSLLLSVAPGPTLNLKETLPADGIDVAGWSALRLEAPEPPECDGRPPPQPGGADWERVARMPPPDRFLDRLAADPAADFDLAAGLARLAAWNGLHRQAAKYALQALRLDPEDVHLSLLGARSLRDLGRFDEALALLERVEGRPKAFPILWLEQGVILFRMGRVEEAVRRLAELLERRPDHDEARFWLARAELAAGRPDSAAGHLRPLVERAPAEPRYLLLAGEVEVARGRFDEARSLFREVAERAPRLAVRGLLRLGHALRRAGDREQAEAVFRRVLELDGDNRWALKALGAPG